MAKASEFSQLARIGEEEEGFDVLRITSLDSNFDIAIRVFSGKYSDGTHHFLGPMLVLNGHLPNKEQAVQSGILIELRPKLCSLAPNEPNSATVERIVQWMASSRFKPIRVNASGGRWVGYGHQSDA